MPQPRFARSILILLVALLFFAQSANAWRAPPAPFIERFNDGYGLVLVSIARIVEVPATRPYDWSALEIAFRIEEVVAPPTVKPEKQLQPGESFKLRTCVGEGDPIEEWFDAAGNRTFPLLGGSPPVGAKFVMSIRYDAKEAQWIDADGAGAAEPVIVLSKERRGELQALHEIAALTGAARLNRCRAAAGDSATSLAVRLDCIKHLERSGRRSYGPDTAAAREAERRDTVDAFRAIWSDAARREPNEVFRQLDDVLDDFDREAFRDSDFRRDAWLQHVFAPPFPADAAAVEIELSRRPVASLASVGGSHPDKIAARLIREMNDNAWPLKFRFELYCALKDIRQQSTSPAESWETASRDFLIQNVDKLDGFSSRCLSDTFQNELGIDGKNRRPMMLTPELADSFKRLHRRLAARAAADAECKLAELDLRHIVDWIALQQGGKLPP